MKKLFFLAALFFSVVSYSQIEFIESSTKVDIVGQVEFVYLEKVGDNESYNLFYKNINNPINEYVFFSFKNTNDDVSKLHQIMLKGFEEMPMQKFQIKANGDVIFFKYERGDDGEMRMQIQQYVSRDPDVMTVSKFLTLNEVNKLFQK
ncbi:hypothetical protein [uncultured Tenacibaculum sp.]|uniref:hypothetical protein n=1 Tax=uncultured Tenacibaculum sp. TaxID=174713 RepID=UPI0026188315|nr:hypothetical protein [uncultured Tenacibaculum sp.]